MIHTETLKNFINGQSVDDFGYFLRIENLPNVKKTNKLQLINYNEMLHELFFEVEKKQKLTHEEMEIEKSSTTMLHKNNPKCLLAIKKNEKFSRNEKCPATGKKYKHCCGAL